MSHPSRCGTDCDSTTNQHPVAMSHPSRHGTNCDSTTNTSCSNVPSFKACDRLWLHYKPTHPVAMSHPSRHGTDCDSTTNQHIRQQCPILQGVGQTVTPLQTNTSCSNVPSFKAWDKLWLHYKPTHPVAMSHPSRCGTDCDSTTNQHPVAMSHPSRHGTNCDSTTNTSCSNVPSFKACDRLWLHYKPTHPVAMSHPSRHGTDCDSTTNQHIRQQCPILQGVGQTVTPLQTNTSCSNVPSFKAWDKLWLHYKPTHPVAMSHPSRHGTDCDSTTNQHIL